jgi:hypothetical protein
MEEPQPSPALDIKRETTPNKISRSPVENSSDNLINMVPCIFITSKIKQSQLED